MPFVKVLGETLETYEKILDLIAPLGLVVLLVSSFLMLATAFMAGGAGFVKYADMPLDPFSLALVALVSLVGIFAFSFLAVGVTAVVKFRRTMDDISFVKLANRALAYSWRVTLAWLILGLVSLGLGLVFSILEVPNFLLALVFLVLWAGLIFLPQVIVLDNAGLGKAISWSIKYSIKNPGQVLIYYAFSLVLVSLLVLLETALEQEPALYFIAPFISSLFLFLFIVPFLEILKCIYYLTTKYRITKAGLK